MESCLKVREAPGTNSAGTTPPSKKGPSVGLSGLHTASDGGASRPLPACELRFINLSCREVPPANDGKVRAALELQRLIGLLRSTGPKGKLSRSHGLASCSFLMEPAVWAWPPHD